MEDTQQEKIEQLAQSKDNSNTYTISHTFHFNWDDYIVKFFKKLFHKEDK